MSNRLSQMWERIKTEIGAELMDKGKHGSHELAAALFNGSAYVMYPRTNEGKDEPHHGLPEMQKAKEMDRGGMEM